MAGKGAPLGNTYGIGNPGPVTRNPLTQQLIAQLHEFDRDHKKENKQVIAEMLIKLAKGGVFKYKAKVKDKKGVARIKWVEQWFPPDINAIREIFDRTQGKAPQQVNVDATLGPRAEGTALDRLRALVAGSDPKILEGESREVVGQSQ